MSAVLLLWMVAFSPAAVFAQRGDESNSTGLGGLLYERRGNVSLAGVFGGRSGKECGGDVERGLEEIISAIWTIEALNAYQYLPGVSIGLSVFDVCEPLNDETTLHKMAEELSRFDEEIINMGIITTREISKKLAGISEEFPDSNILRIEHIVSDDMLTDITTQLLINLHWTNVSTVIFDSETAMVSFGERASEEGISVGESVLMNCSSVELGGFEDVEQSVVAVIASFANIARLADSFHKENIKLILTPTDFLFDFGLLDLPRDTIVCLPSMQDKRALSGHLRNILRRKDFFTRTPPVKGPLFVGTAASIIRFLKPLRTAVQANCRDEKRPCAPVTHFLGEIRGNKTHLPAHDTTEITPDDVEEALKVLKIEPNFNDEMFLCVAVVINGNASEDVAIFQVFNLKLKTFRAVPIMINDHSLSTRRVGGGVEGEARGRTQTKPPREDLAASFLQEDGSPSENLPEGNVSAAEAAANATDLQVSWRYLTWVSVNTCVGLVGVTCTLSIMLFIMVKICKNRFIEGSPCFTLVLMVVVVLTYVSALPFHMDFPEEGFMCGYRKCAPPVVFAVLFSLLLSRSLMVALIEAGGGSGHINGYLQSVLSAFMIGVQVSISTQNWVVAKGIYDSTTCGDMYDKYNIISALVYDFLLLILLACVSPFIVRSKRNCKEGLLFSISVFFITIVWSAWISFYVFLPKEDKDAAVVVGLNSTASVLLLCVFIPQMYFMAAPFSQDQAIRAFSSLDTNALAAGSHPDFKSNLALNDCTFGSYKNCQMGCSNPTFLDGRPNGSGTSPGATATLVAEPLSSRTPEPPQSN